MIGGRFFLSAGEVLNILVGGSGGGGGGYSGGGGGAYELQQFDGQFGKTFFGTNIYQGGGRGSFLAATAASATMAGGGG